MTSLSAFKKAIVLPAILASVFSTQALATDLDTDGFRKDKNCDTLEVITNTTVKVDNQKPTGIKASTTKWDMEIYQDSDGRWTLVGLNKSPKDKYEQACVLMSGPAKRPYATQAFYTKHFKPSTNVALSPAKPNLN